MHLLTNGVRVRSSGSAGTIVKESALQILSVNCFCSFRLNPNGALFSFGAIHTTIDYIILRPVVRESLLDSMLIINMLLTHFPG